MIQPMPQPRDILKWNRHLPDIFKQSSVVLEFKKDMPRYLTENFYRIHMTQDMLSMGDDDFWLPEITQPKAMGEQRCLACRRMMKKLGVMSSICVNRNCDYAGRAVIAGPKIGVHSIKTDFDVFDSGRKKMIKVSFIVGQEWKSVTTEAWWNIGMAALRKEGMNQGLVRTDDDLERSMDVIRTYLKWPEGKVPMPMVRGCLVVLDRRYSEQCLCRIWRTCGMLCEEIGWELK